MRKLISFGSDYRALSLSERISNGLRELASTIGVTLSFFIIIFSISLDKRGKAHDCEEKGLIENIDNLNPAIVTIDKYILLIVGILFSMPVLFFCFYKLKKSQNYDDEFTEPILES